MALRYYLEHNVDVSGFNPRGAAFETRAKREMIADNKSDLEAWVRSLRDDPGRILQGLGNAVAAAQCDLFTTAQLLTVYCPPDAAGDRQRVTANRLARELKAARFMKPHEKVRTRSGTHALWIVRNRDLWRTANPLKCAQHWESFWCVPAKHEAGERSA